MPARRLTARVEIWSGVLRESASRLEPLALLLATLAAYYPAWHGGMLWDDNAHLTRPELQSTAGSLAHLVRCRRHAAVPTH